MKSMGSILGQRLAASRKRAGLAQIELAAALGDRYSQSVISDVERGRSGLLVDGLVNAARELGVSLDYLIGLTEDPTPAAQLSEAAHRHVDAKGRASARSTAETRASYGVEYDADGYQEHIERLEEVAAAAGSGAEGFDEMVTSTVPFRRDWLRRHRINPKHCKVIGVRGASMEPTLPNKCSIIVDRSQKQLRQGRIYVMRTEEGLVVKRAKHNAQGWWLLSDNPDWPPLMLTEETDIIGEVRWVGVAF